MLSKKDHNEYQQAVREIQGNDKLFDWYCRARGLASDLLLAESPGIEEIGSSDVSGRLWELWYERKQQSGQSDVHVGLAFFIFNKIKDEHDPSYGQEEIRCGSPVETL